MKSQWFVIHTLSGQELKVKDSIEKRLKAEEMGEFIKEVLVPMEKIVDVRGGHHGVLRCLRGSAHGRGRAFGKRKAASRCAARILMASATRGVAHNVRFCGKVVCGTRRKSAARAG